MTIGFKRYDDSGLQEFVLMADIGNIPGLLEIYKPVENFIIKKDDFVDNHLFFDTSSSPYEKIRICHKQSNTEECTRINPGFFSKSYRVDLISKKLPLRDNIFNLYYAISKLQRRFNKNKNFYDFPKRHMNEQYPVLRNQAGGAEESLYDILIKQATGTLKEEFENRSFYQIGILDEDGNFLWENQTIWGSKMWYYINIETLSDNNVSINSIVKINRFLVVEQMYPVVKGYFTQFIGTKYPFIISSLARLIDERRIPEYMSSKQDFIKESKEYYPAFKDHIRRLIDKYKDELKEYMTNYEESNELGKKLLPVSRRKQRLNANKKEIISMINIDLKRNNRQQFKNLLF